MVLSDVMQRQVSVRLSQSLKQKWLKQRRSLSHLREKEWSSGPVPSSSSKAFLVEQETYRFLMVEGKIADIQIPPSMIFEVVDTAPVEHVGGSTSVYKEAKLASGLIIQVPLFIKNGDKIRVGTENREYLGKAH